MATHSMTYEEVAMECSRFRPTDGAGSKNPTSLAKTQNVSCKNCYYFEDNRYCVLDLYDQIVMNHTR
ncbi:MAG: hypothetical protein K6G65_09330 [Lachnospiraceae bacterium]|nr:hypothetical protein [Lachnospiraceae bacterium]